MKSKTKKGKIIIEQAMELYTLGISIEQARIAVADMYKKYGSEASQTLDKVDIFKKLTNQFNLLEAKHIKDIEKIYELDNTSINKS